MIKNIYVIDSENWYYQMPTKHDAEQFIENIKENDNQKDIRFVYAKCEINENDPNEFTELETLKVFMD